MKRSLFSIILIAILMVTTACGQSGQPAAGFSQEDLYLNIDDQQYRLNTDIETVTADRGSGYEYSEGKSCDYDGLDKIFIYADAEFYTWPMSEGDLVNEIYTQSAKVTTSKGIAVGASKADILAVYGDGGEDTGYQLIYSADGGSLCFDLEDDIVTAIYIAIQLS